MHPGKLAFISGAFFGLTGVILGALGAHALENVLSADQLGSFETAVRFQMYHGLFLLLLGLLAQQYFDRWINLAIRAALVGTVLFSGSIYLLTLTDIQVGLVTPVGGVILMVGWGSLLGWAIRKKGTTNREEG